MKIFYSQLVALPAFYQSQIKCSYHIPLHIWPYRLAIHAAVGISWDWSIPLSGENLRSESWD